MSCGATGASASRNLSQSIVSKNFESSSFPFLPFHRRPCSSRQGWCAQPLPQKLLPWRRRDSPVPAVRGRPVRQLLPLLVAPVRLQGLLFHCCRLHWRWRRHLLLRFLWWRRCWRRCRGWRHWGLHGLDHGFGLDSVRLSLGFRAKVLEPKLWPVSLEVASHISHDLCDHSMGQPLLPGGTSQVFCRHQEQVPVVRNPVRVGLALSVLFSTQHNSWTMPSVDHSRAPSS